MSCLGYFFGLVSFCGHDSLLIFIKLPWKCPGLLEEVSQTRRELFLLVTLWYLHMGREGAFQPLKL